MRQSRLAVFNEVKAQLDAKGEEFIKQYFCHLSPPKVFYEIRVNYRTHPEIGYHIAECPVTQVTYYWQLPWFNKRPTPEDIEKLRALLDSTLDSKWIRIHTAIAGEGSWAHAPALFGDTWERGQPQCSFDREDLEPELARLIETYVPKPGQFKCRYCSKATDESKKVKGTIISRQYSGFQSREFGYCSKECNCFDQMAHEG